MSQELKQVVLFLVRGYFPAVDAAYLARRLGIPTESAKGALDSLASQGLLICNDGKYTLNPRSPVIGGRFQSHSRGFGFVHVAGGMHYYVSSMNSRGAEDGDIVWGSVQQGEPGKADQVRVEEILDKNTPPLVGLYRETGGLGRVRIGDRQLMIPSRDNGGAVDGSPVVVLTMGWEAKVLEVLPSQDVALLDVLSLAASRGFAPGFSRRVRDTARAVKTDIQRELSVRKDLRNVTVVSIDTESCRDIDDAFSVEKLSHGGFRLGLHISDVAQYVYPGDAVDKEALKRGFSAYMPGNRIIPMLPEEYTYQQCSLLQGQERLCISCFATVSADGEIMGYSFEETVVKNSREFSYQEAVEVLNHGGQGEAVQVLKLAAEMQTLLQQRRRETGAIAIDLPSAGFTLDVNGKPVAAEVFEKNAANLLVEELMLLGNELAARYLVDNGLAGIFRSNRGFMPGCDKEVNQFIQRWGHGPVNTGDSQPLQELLDNIQGKPEEIPVMKQLARKLQKSRYTTKEEGHFVLALPHYTHFTAPLRRYSDIAVHRVIKAHLRRHPPVADQYLHLVAEHCSYRERQVQEAENSALQLKKNQYMEQCGDKSFSAIVTQVLPGGLQVWLSNTVEGSAAAGVPREKLAEFKPGDVISVRLHRLDQQRNQLVFAIDLPQQ
jgi:ribonuclease R